MHFIVEEGFYYFTLTDINASLETNLKWLLRKVLQY